MKYFFKYNSALMKQNPDFFELNDTVEEKFGNNWQIRGDGILHSTQ